VGIYAKLREFIGHNAMQHDKIITEAAMKNDSLRPKIPDVALPQAGRQPSSRLFDLPKASELEPFSAIDALYVHIPFCTTKCHYCDFFSLAGHLDQSEAFINAMGREFELQTAHFGRPAPETIFIGGGTPTLLSPALLARLLEQINNAIKTDRLIEFTVEANPNTFDARKAGVLREGGVNRISFGAQSFSMAELAVLQRDHNPENVPIAMDIARKAGIDNLNLDLIFGIPGQSMEQWDHNLERAIALNPSHLSCYGLMYEPNTPMTARMKRGEITPADEDLEIAMLRHTRSRLAAAGFARYEISNYALPGRACRHNINYWNARNHLAVGPSAAGYHSGFRWKNVSSLTRYIDCLSGQTPEIPVTEMEHLTGLSRWGELAILQLRLEAGIEWREFKRRTGVDAREILATMAARYVAMDLIKVNDDAITLTQAGIAVSDTIFADVLEAFAQRIGKLPLPGVHDSFRP
jgi:oxygen-independent coproporphyrinogen-3 oxidase